MKLAGRRVLITGASSGVGVAAAEAFAREGADVALLARSEQGLERVAARVRAHGSRALVLACDLKDTDQTLAAMRRVELEWGGLDVLVPNAAATLFGPFRDAEPDDFDAVVAATLLGDVHLVRAALPLLERSAGAIVATGSINARAPLPNFSSYATAKHGLRGFLNTLRVELRAAGSPVRVSQVHPGGIATPVWDTTSSTSGRLPRHPPWGYAPEVIARALVSCAIKPRREAVVGLEAKFFDLLWRSPLADPVLVLVSKYMLSGRRAAPRPGSATAAQGRGDARGSTIARPSISAPLRFRRR